MINLREQDLLAHVFLLKLLLEIMIAQLNGKLIFKSSTQAVIDCGGVGYLTLISINTSEQLPEVNNDVMLNTLLIPREDSLTLYGFIDKVEREAFKILISISGVGPKIALGILSSVSVGDFQQYILQGNLHALTKLPGIGKKTAERLLLELKDKITRLGEFDTSSQGIEHNLLKQEALSALLTLGYSRAIADKSIRKAYDEIKSDNMTAEILIKVSLKYAMM